MEFVFGGGVLECVEQGGQVGDFVDSVVGFGRSSLLRIDVGVGGDLCVDAVGADKPDGWHLKGVRCDEVL